MATDTDGRRGRLQITVLGQCIGACRIEPFFQPAVGRYALVPGEIETAEIRVENDAGIGLIGITAVQLPNNPFVRIEEGRSRGTGLVNAHIRNNAPMAVGRAGAEYAAPVDRLRVDGGGIVVDGYFFYIARRMVNKRGIGYQGIGRRGTVPAVEIDAVVLRDRIDFQQHKIRFRTEGDAFATQYRFGHRFGAGVGAAGAFIVKIETPGIEIGRRSNQLTVMGGEKIRVAAAAGVGNQRTGAPTGAVGKGHQNTGHAFFFRLPVLAL